MNLNEILVKVAKILAVFLIFLVGGFILHTSVFGRIQIGVVIPNVLLIITSAFGFMKGSKWGMAYGFLAGLMVDSFLPDYFGLNCLFYLLLGYLNGLLKRFFFGDDMRLPLLFVLISDVLYGSAVYVFLFMVRGRFDFFFYFSNIIMPEAVYSVLVFLLLYFPLVWAFRWVGTERSDRGRGFGEI